MHVGYEAFGVTIAPYAQSPWLVRLVAAAIAVRPWEGPENLARQTSAGRARAVGLMSDHIFARPQQISMYN